MLNSPILDALDRLNAGIGTLENAVTSVEAKIKSATAKGKKRTDQMDLFGGPITVPAPAPMTGKNIDTEDMARRMSRVIDQIESVLAQAA